MHISAVKQLESTIALAREWVEFSRNYNGSTTMYYEDTRVYFADGTDFTAVEMSTKYGKIEVYFHRTPEINNLTIKTAHNLKRIIDESRNQLEKLVAEYRNRTQEEIERDKQLKIEHLKNQLNELENS